MKHRVVSQSGNGWAGVPVEGYQPGAPPGVERHTLIGGRKRSPDEPGPQNEVRYFRLWPGKVSRLEKHEHEHYVIIGEGEGYAISATSFTTSRRTTSSTSARSSLISSSQKVIGRSVSSAPSVRRAISHRSSVRRNSNGSKTRPPGNTCSPTGCRGPGPSAKKASRRPPGSPSIPSEVVSA